MSQPPPFPDPATLSDPQVRGAACVHCGVRLDPRTAIDLGQRMVRRGEQWVRWFPRACPPHGARR